MLYTESEVMEFVAEDDVKFIRLAFSDGCGKQRNLSIMPSELQRAFEFGIPFDASACFADAGNLTDLYLIPDPSTLQVLPWRPSHGKVVRMYCNIQYPNGEPFELDGRQILKRAIEEGKKHGIYCEVGAEYEFYLFKTDEVGNPTKIPHDFGGYFSIAPEDKGENIRREICLALEEMGVAPYSSHHEKGPGQHEIDFMPSAPLTAADNSISYKTAVRTIAERNGLYADFSPKPFADKPGNGLHLKFSLLRDESGYMTRCFMAGIMAYIRELTVFLNPTEDSYLRLNSGSAPNVVSWAKMNRTQLIRVPVQKNGERKFELRSPDAELNPYTAIAGLICAGIEGVVNNMQLCHETDMNMFALTDGEKAQFERLPASLDEAKRLAANSEFVKKYLPQKIINAYTE